MLFCDEQSALLNAKVNSCTDADGDSIEKHADCRALKEKTSGHTQFSFLFIEIHEWGDP